MWARAELKNASCSGSGEVAGERDERNELPQVSKVHRQSQFAPARHREGGRQEEWASGLPAGKRRQKQKQE